MTASLVFVNFRKAFDTLHRSSIPVIFSQYNVPICLISDITQMYRDTSACVSTELGPIEWFKTSSGVLQGDTLSPYLFIVLLDYALKKTLQDDVGFVIRKRNGSWHLAIHIGVLAYADDICLLAESIDNVKCSLHRLETSAAEIGLTINYNKTKAMHLGQASVRHVCFANGDPVDSCKGILMAVNYYWCQLTRRLGWAAPAHNKKEGATGIMECASIVSSMRGGMMDTLGCRLG